MGDIVMDWNDWLRVLRWRALEESDPDGSLVSLERRYEATARTRGGLTSDDIRTGDLTDRESAFLLKRATWLEQELLGFRGPLVQAWERLKTLQGRWGFAIAGWVVALIGGYMLTNLGQGHEFNLLSLPLVSVLAWNAIVMVLALLWEWWPSGNSKGGGFSEWLTALSKRVPAETPGDTESPLTRTAEETFARWATPLAWDRQQRRMRTWLHIGAALLALGSCVALYARGWSKEYRAVWESTLLTQTGAERFFNTLFGPASNVFHLPIPVSEIEGMHRTNGQTRAPSPALPWIHLYAGTLILLVITPRLLLAGMTLARSGGVWKRGAKRLNWNPYLTRTLRAIEGSSETLSILVHTMDPTESQRDVWTRGIRGRFGGRVQPDFIRIAHGDEDDFADTWQPAGPKAAIVFNLATTPEAEVQRQLVIHAAQRLKSRYPDMELMVLLDATSVAGRWSADKQASRERLWSEMLRNTGAEIIVAAKKAGGAASPSLPAPGL